jgi:hypothetical protein
LSRAEMAVRNFGFMQQTVERLHPVMIIARRTRTKHRD